MSWGAERALRDDGAERSFDQLVRNNGLASDKTTAIASALDAAEKQSGAARGTALTALAKQVDGYATGAKDAARVRMLSSEIKRLAGASK